MMSVTNSFWLIYVTFSIGFIYIACAFNVEELKYINYEVDISVTPVKREEISHPAVYITSKSGQEFQCLLPQLNEEEISEKEVITEKDTDVIELLKPMKTSSCLSKGKDWWTYEFCFGHYIKQFHIEDGQIIGQVITLGLYESDYDWNNETDQEKFKHTKQRYHSQYYTNGTKCDLTGQPRNAEVRIYCEEDAGDYIHRVDEPGTCSYIITVHTSLLCSHPLLKPLPSHKAHSITCHPLLNEEQYSNYLQKLKEEKALAEEKRSQWLTNQQERLQVMKNVNTLPIDDDAENTPSVDSKTLNLNSVKKNYEMVRAFLLQEYDKQIEKLKTLLPPEKFISVKNDIQKEFDAILDEAKQDFESGLSEEAKDIRLFKLTSVLNMLLEKFDKAEKDVVKATKQPNKAKSAVSDGHTSDSGDNTDDETLKDVNESKENEIFEDDAENTPSVDSKTLNLNTVKKNYEMVRAFLLQEYEKQMEKLKTSLPPEKFISVKNDVQKQFDTILDEAKQDFESGHSEEAEDISLSKLTSVLNMLLVKLDKAEKDVVKATKELSTVGSAISDDHTSDSGDSTDDEILRDVNVNKENEIFDDTLKITSDDQSRTAVLDDDKLQVRIRRLDRKSSDASGKLHEMDFEQRKKLEQAVKEKLEKAGLDTGGRRIEVKIITAGYYDNEDGKDFQSLTDEETDQFQNMIMALLTGQQEAVQEMKRHKKLEENYKFTWDDREETDNKED